ncbi:MAG TPA: RNA ligase (ATP) [Nannocystis exedens]|nr:RNA ligase (ATP) [Nannocystis exedens]
MSTFTVPIVSVVIEPHDNADALEIARVGDYRSVVPKGEFKSGELVAYIPEQALLPAPLLQSMGLTGKLAGSDHNRVKAIRLRGVLSQGLVLRARPEWSVGDNVAAELGIVKWEPPVPSCMSGQVYGAGSDRCLKYDIENFKAFPEVFEEGEAVVFTEKIHGTWCQMGLLPEGVDAPHGRLVVASKGLASKGLAFLPDAEDNRQNLYLRVARHLEIERRMGQVFAATLAEGTPVFVLGEVFGKGVQDLSYGAKSEQDRWLGFRIFDIYRGWPGQGEYLSDEDLEAACTMLDLDRVPVLYRGTFSYGIMQAHTDGRESVSGERLHMREGIVIRPQIERRDPLLGRVQLKNVSEKYLLRKGGTEHN